MRYFTIKNHLPSRDAKLKDLPKFYIKALDEEFDELTRKSDEFDRNFDKLAIEDGKDENDSSTKKLPISPAKELPTKFTDETIVNAHIYHDVPMRMTVGAACDVLETRLLPGRKFNFTTFTIVMGTYLVNSEDAKLLSFNNCGLGPGGEFKFLLFSLDDGQFAFVIPLSLVEQFLGRPAPSLSSNDLFQDFEKVTMQLPLSISKYVHFNEKYVVLHAKVIDAFILSYANSQLGKFFPADRLEDATRQLYEEKERDASYLGITATSTFLIRVGPLVYFVLSFELWRRVRRLPYGRLKSGRYWFAFETRDIVGRFNGYLHAVAPLLFGVLMYSLFAISQSLGLIVFGRILTIPGLFTWSFPIVFAPTSGQTDYFALVIAFVLVPIHFLILLLTAYKLTRIVRANAQRV